MVPASLAPTPVRHIHRLTHCSNFHKTISYIYIYIYIYTLSFFLCFSSECARQKNSPSHQLSGSKHERQGKTRILPGSFGARWFTSVWMWEGKLPTHGESKNTAFRVGWMFPPGERGKWERFVQQNGIQQLTKIMYTTYRLSLANYKVSLEIRVSWKSIVTCVSMCVCGYWRVLNWWSDLLDSSIQSVSTLYNLLLCTHTSVHS
jgi:hypothetical protein